jgi:hypothetical protein
LVALSGTQREDLEGHLVEFDHDWDEQRLNAWVQKLPARDDPLRRPALIEMVKIDLERQWQRGHRLLLEEYVRRYPELGSVATIPPDLIQAEVAVQRQFSATADLAELARRFPQHAKHLRQLLQTDPGDRPTDRWNTRLKETLQPARRAPTKGGGVARPGLSHPPDT